MKIGKRVVTVSVSEKRDCSKSFLRILARGDVEKYVSDVTKDCVSVR